MATPPVFSAGSVLTAGQMNAVGLWRVASGTLSGTTEDFQGVFTSDFTNYVITVDQIAFSGAADLYWRMMNGSTVITASNYFWGFNGYTSGGAGADSGAASQAAAYTGVTNGAGVANVKIGSCVLHFMNPQIAQRTLVLTQAMSYTTAYRGLSGAAAHDLTTAYDGVQFLTLSAATFEGNVTIYGYREP